MEQSQHRNKELGFEVSVKQYWVAPEIIPINADAIRQQEEEVMQLLLSDPDSFRLLTGSLPSGG